MGEADRLKMRQEAERVMAAHPLVSSDPHLMAVFAVTLLDHLEDAEERSREEELDLAVTRLLNALGNAIDHMEANGLRAEGFKKVLREESR